MKPFFLSLIFLAATLVYTSDIPYANSFSEKNYLEIKKFYRIDPYDSLVKHQQICKFFHDGNSLHFLIQTPIHKNFKKGNFTTRDEIPEADYYRIQIVTDLASKFAYAFLFFPLENRCDLIRDFEFNSDYNWNSNYEYSSAFSDSLWTITGKIPFSDLRFYGEPPYNWKMIVTRKIEYHDETYNSPLVSTQMHDQYFYRGHDITINHTIKKQQTLFIRPYAIVNLDLKSKDTEFDEDNVGLDFSYRFSSSSNLKITLNPDFSDVPMDTERDIYNSRHAPTLEENRYFFIEDLNAFGTNQNTFYTRYIMQPKYALKLTGFTKKYSYGILSTQDKYIEFQDDSNADDHFNIVAFKPIWDKFNCQLTLLNRMNEDYHNEIFHLKPTWEIDETHEINLDTNLSLKEENDSVKKGYYLIGNYSLKNKDFVTTLSLKQMSKDYNIDMGRTYQENFYGWNLDTYLKKNINGKFLRKFYSKIILLEEIDNDSGKLLERYLSTGIDFYSNYDLNFYFDFVYVKEFYHQDYFNKIRLGGYVSWTKFDLLKLRFGYNKINYIIYNFAETHAGFNTSYAAYGSISEYFEYDIGFEHTKYNDFERPAAELKENYVDDDYWIGNINLNLHLSNNISLNNGVRFNNFEIPQQDDYTGLFSNLRIDMMHNFNLYLGYKTSIIHNGGESQTECASSYLKIVYLF